MTVSSPDSSSDRPVWRSLWRGLSGRCPACGRGRLFSGYVRVRDYCDGCGEALHHHRADDMAPYVAMFLSAHVVVPMALVAAVLWAFPGWMHLAMFLPLALVITLALLPAVKGAIVGIEWALRQHGFACETLRTRSTHDAKRAPSNDR